MKPPMKPFAVRPMDGDEIVFFIQDGRLRRLTMSALKEELNIPSIDIDQLKKEISGIDVDKLKQDIINSIKIPEYKNRRIEFLSTTTGKQTTFTNPFSKPPIIIRQSTWSGNQHIIPFVVNVSNTSVTLGAKMSRSTILLNSGPYTDAPNDTPVEVVLIEQL